MRAECRNRKGAVHCVVEVQHNTFGSGEAGSCAKVAVGYKVFGQVELGVDVGCSCGSARDSSSHGLRSDCGGGQRPLCVAVVVFRAYLKPLFLVSVQSGSTNGRRSRSIIFLYAAEAA